MPEVEVNLKKAKFYDVFFVGFCLMISKMPTFWNSGLSFGFWEYLVCALLLSVAYIALASCLAEMTSILPFSGGSYGFARVTMGPFMGFVIGCSDSISNIYYGLMLVQNVTAALSDFLGGSLPTHSEPILWLVIYVFCLLMHIVGGRYSFSLITIFGILSFFTCIAFILSTAPHQNFEKYVLREDNLVMYDHRIGDFMYVLPIANWMYLGVDMMCLVCDDTENAKHVVPRTIVACMTITVVLALLIFLCASDQRPGFKAVAGYAFPLNPGFSQAFGMPEHLTSAFNIPLVLAGLYCLMYSYGRQMCAMARSKLLPDAFTSTTKDNVPYVSLMVGTAVGYGILLFHYCFVRDYVTILNYIYFSALMCTISVYMTVSMCFILFRLRYGSLQRDYVNPFGVTSALVAMGVFTFSYIAAAGYSTDGGLAAKVYAGFIAYVVLCYFCYSRNRQTFSPEEKNVLFRAYIIKANSKHRTFYNWAVRKLKQVNGDRSSSRIMSEEPVEIGPYILPTKVKPKSKGSSNSASQTGAAVGGLESSTGVVTGETNSGGEMPLYDLVDHQLLAEEDTTECNNEGQEMTELERPSPVAQMLLSRPPSLSEWLQGLRSKNTSKVAPEPDGKSGVSLS